MNILQQPQPRSKRLPYSDFERARRDHTNKQIDFVLKQITDELEAKLKVDESNSFEYSALHG